MKERLEYRAAGGRERSRAPRDEAERAAAGRARTDSHPHLLLSDQTAASGAPVTVS